MDSNNPSGSSGNNSRLQEMQKNVDVVVDIMADNVEKTMKRGADLEHLEDISRGLEDRAQEFQTTTVKLRKKYWWQNMKMKLIIAGIVCLLLIIIIVACTV